MRHAARTFLLICLSGPFAAAALANQGQADPVSSLVVRERVLAELPGDPSKTTWMVDREGRVAYVAKQGRAWAVVFDGATGPPFDEVVEDSLALLAGARVAYVAKRQGKWFAVAGVEVSGPWDHIAGRRIGVSGDGRRYGFCARRGRAWHSVLDGVESAAGTEPLWGPPVLNEDGSRVALVVGSPLPGSDEGMRVVVDGQESRRYPAIGGAWLSPDGRHLAFTATIKDKRLMVIDGEEGPAFAAFPFWLEYRAPDGRWSPFGPSGRTAYTGERRDKVVSKWWTAGLVEVTDDKATLMIDGRPDREIGGAFWNLVFSPDGKRIACWATKEGGVFNGDYRVVVDGKEGPKHDGPEDGPVFSADGQALAYAARSNGKAFVIVNGEWRWVHDEILRGSLRFSADGTHLAYVMREGKAWFLCVDGRKGQTSSGPNSDSIKFIADGRHLMSVWPSVTRRRYVAMAWGEPLFPSWTRDSVRFVACRGRQILWLEATLSGSAPLPEL